MDAISKSLPVIRLVLCLIAALAVALASVSVAPVPAAAAGDLQAAIDSEDRGQHAKAIRFATRAIKSGKVKGVALARAYLVRADAYWYSGDEKRGNEDSERAIAEIDELLKEDRLSGDDLALAYNTRGLANKQLGRAAAAISDFTAAAEVSPSFFKAYLNRGTVHLHHRRYELALKDYEAAERAKPDYTKAIYSRARTLVRVGRYREAMAAYDKAVNMDPKGPIAWACYMGRGNVRFLQGDFAKAIADYKRSLALNPNFALTKKNLARARKEQRQAAKSPDTDIDSLWDDLLSAPDTRPIGNKR